jgi:DNA-binding protein HU-beta
MNKAELIAKLAEKVGLSKKQTGDVIEAFVDTVIEALQGGNEVTIAGFGSFSARERAGRMGVNPQNPSEKMEIAPVTVPKFKAGTGLKKALKHKNAIEETAPLA